MPPFGRALLAEFPLDPSITYLNHGTVGVTPLRVLAAQQSIRDEIERQPSRFLLRELTAPATSVGMPRGETPRLRVAAAEVASFLGARGDDLVFVDNATTGANAVLRSFPFSPGDEVIVTDLGYGGVINAARFRGTREGRRSCARSRCRGRSARATWPTPSSRPSRPGRGSRSSITSPPRAR